jgi:flagellar biogenesis protein FliO
MRPIGRLVCCAAALISSVASAQTHEQNPPAPTIHSSGQHANAVPLPPLPISNALDNSVENFAGSTSNGAAPTYASNAGWVSGPGNNATAALNNPASNVIPAGYSTPLSSTEQSKHVATRTPLNPPTSPATIEASKSSSGNTVRMLLSVGSSLLIVIGLFLGVAWCYRKTLNTSMGGIPKHVVSVLGRTAIAPRQQLVLVRFGSKLVLVSMVQGEARTISEITDPLEVDQLAGACESHQPHSLTNSFRSILNQNGGGAI